MGLNYFVFFFEEIVSARNTRIKFKPQLVKYMAVNINARLIETSAPLLNDPAYLAKKWFISPKVRNPHGIFPIIMDNIPNINLSSGEGK